MNSFRINSNVEQILAINEQIDSYIENMGETGLSVSALRRRIKVLQEKRKELSKELDK